METYKKIISGIVVTGVAIGGAVWLKSHSIKEGDKLLVPVGTDVSDTYWDRINCKTISVRGADGAIVEVHDGNGNGRIISKKMDGSDGEWIEVRVPEEFSSTGDVCEGLIDSRSVKKAKK